MPNLHNSILVTGPSRSGKSEFAERLVTQQVAQQVAQQNAAKVIYIATAQQNRDDREWQDRIAQHRDRRPATWHTLEVERDVAASLHDCNQQDTVPPVLIDSLGTWVANWLDDEAVAWEETCDRLLAEISVYQGLVVCVAEETGWSLVPADAISRLFRDRLGALTRRVAAAVDHAYLVVAGYAIDLKQVGVAIDADPPSPHR